MTISSAGSSRSPCWRSRSGPFPRLKAGAQGLLAVSLGLFAVAGAVEGVYYTQKLGPAGDDFTSLLAAPAALALFGVGAAAFWTSRRAAVIPPGATAAARCSSSPGSSA